VFSEDECSKKYQTEVTEMKKIMLLLSKVTCIMALAVLSVNSTCGFTAYQPDVPESLEHD
jgi:cyclic lactone autoinducer peptide